MVLHVAAHAGQVADHRNPQPGQVRRRADAGQHQQLGRLNRSGAEDDFPALDGEGLLAAFNLQPHCPGAVEDHPVDHHAAPDGQVEPVAAGVEVGQGGAHADAAGVVERHRAHAGPVGVVQVRVVGEPGGDAGPVEGGLNGQPRLPGVPPHRNGAVGAVEVAANVGVGLQLSKEGQDVDVRPFVVALGGPIVVVLRRAPQENLVVDGAGAAHHLAARHRSRAALLGRGLTDERPVVRPVDLGCRLVEVVPNLIGDRRRAGVVRPGFQQQDGPVRVFRQAGGQNASGGTRAHYNNVVSHRFT